MKNSKQNAESKGVVLFAFNTDTVDYIAIADNCARLIAKYLKLPVTLITESGAKPAFSYDRVITVDYSGANQRTDVVTRKQVQWKNFGRYTVYEHSPYDHTLMLDTDYLVLDNSLLKLFDQPYDYRIMGHSDDFNKSMPARMGNVSLPYLWATVVLFRKSSRSECFFSLVGKIQRNWGYYRSLFNVDGAQYRNDFAFAMADIILNGYSLNQSKTIPWNMLTVSGEVTKLELKDNTVVVRTPEKAYLVPKHNIHIMHKQYLMSEQYQQFVEAAVNV
jgi:hypothetical protein